ncbi:MAG: ABC transporter substrate-binding protein [Hyphomicrobiales bacterium]|nr:ABC transporter substrate-binding protein [Hyphomicrobiales bacterium]
MQGFAFLMALSVTVVVQIASAACAERIKLSATRTTGSAAIYIALEKGLFAREGLDVDLIFFDAAQPVAVAVASGDADLGITGLSAAVYNMGAKQALRIVAGASRDQAGFSNSSFVASNEAYANGLRSPKDIAGKTFGLTQVGSPYHYVVVRLAQKYQFPLSSLKLIPLQSFSNIISAAGGGRVDAGLVQSNVGLPADQRGVVKFIGWAGEETPWQTAAVLTSGATAQKRRSTLERFMRAYIQGAMAYDEVFQRKDKNVSPAEKAQFLDILAKYTRLTHEQILLGLNYIDPLGRLDLEDVRNQIATWKSLGMTDARVEADTMIDTSFLPAGRAP